MDPVALHAQLARLIESCQASLPSTTTSGPYVPTTDVMQLLGRAEALISEAMGVSGDVDFKVATHNLRSHPGWTTTEVLRILYRAIAVAELQLPAPSSGAFIPAGNAFDAITALQRIFSTATRDILIVDAYLSERIFTDFIALAPEAVQVRMMADKDKVKTGVQPALKGWKTQHGKARPISVRLSENLHDRFICTDGSRMWTVGQSFNALATKSPTSFVEVDPETMKLKLEFYEKCCAAGTVL